MTSSVFGTRLIFILAFLTGLMIGSNSYAQVGFNFTLNFSVHCPDGTILPVTSSFNDPGVCNVPEAIACDVVESGESIVDNHVFDQVFVTFTCSNCFIEDANGDISALPGTFSNTVAGPILPTCPLPSPTPEPSATPTPAPTTTPTPAPTPPPVIPPNLDTDNTGNTTSPDGNDITDPNGNDLTNNGSPNNTNEPNCPSGGCPSNLFTGAMWHKLPDFNVKGRTSTTNLKLERTYLAQPVLGNGDFGPNWISNWETQLISVSQTANTNLLWIDQNGGAFTFIRNADNSFTSPASYFGTLTEFSDHYELRQTHDIIYTFSRNPSIAPIGKLLSISEPHGEKLSLSYDSNGKLASVQTGLAGSISFTRDSSGHVTSVTRDRDSLIYTFSYDKCGRLVSSSDFNGNTTTYAYEMMGATSMNMTQKMTMQNVTMMAPSVAVKPALLISITDPLNRQITFSYSSTGQNTSQTEPGGGQRFFAYSTNSTGPVTQVTEIDGSVTIWQFDPSGNPVQVTLPNGGTVKITRNAQKQVIAQTDPLGFTTHYNYDSHGNMISIQKPADPAPIQITYDQNFDAPTNLVPLTGAPYQFSLDPGTGDVLQIQRGNATQSLSLAFTHDAFGNILATNNGLASYSDQTDANGLKILAFDARNPETRAYDNRGRLITSTFKNGRVISYQYDNFDEVLKITDSNGPTILNNYDIVHRLISRTVTDGTTSQVTQFSYDVRNRLVATTDALGRISSNQYDRTVNGVFQVIDKPVKIIDPAGHATQIVYDVMQRAIQKIDARGNSTLFSYDLAGNMTSLTDPDGNQTMFAYDGNRRLITESRPSVMTKNRKTTATTEVTNYAYDASGNLLQKTKVSSSGGSNSVIVNTYDIFDRKIEVVQSKQKSNGTSKIEDDSKFSYEPQLDATNFTSANNQVENLGFTNEAVPPFDSTNYSVAAADPKNPLHLIQDSFIVQRDITSQIAQISNATGNTVLSAQYDPAGRMTQISSGNILGSHSAALSTVLKYDGFGRKISTQHSTGLTGTTVYDLLNRVTNMSWLAKDNDIDHRPDRDDLPEIFENLQYDVAGNIISQDEKSSDLAYQYDSINELIGRTSTKNAGDHDHDRDDIFTRDLTFDPNGNRIHDSVRGTGDFIANFLVSDQKAIYEADPNGFGNLEREINYRGNVKEFAYRSDEKLIGFRMDFDQDRDWNRHNRDDKDHDRSHDFDRDRDLTKVLYFYDALGRRVAKEVGSREEFHGNFTQDYLYLNDQDKILEGRNGDGDLTVYMDGEGIDEHLGEVSKRNALGYATDHLGSVLNTELAGESHKFSPFGESQVKPRFTDNSSPVMYGFTGRQFDPESGFYYYRARQYDPRTGRFTAKDPAGFSSGDANFYRYTQNSPLAGSDPSGLDTLPSSDSGNSNSTCLKAAGAATFSCAKNIASETAAGRAGSLACLAAAEGGPAAVVACFLAVNGAISAGTYAAAILVCQQSGFSAYDSCIGQNPPTCSTSP